MTEVRASSRHRRQTTPAERNVVWVLTAAAALGAAPAGAEPTGLAPLDIALSALAGALVTYLASRSRRWAWLVTSGIAAVGAQTLPGLVPSLLALLVAFLAATFDRRTRVLGAVVGALAVQGLLRFPDWEPQGLATLVAFAGAAPVVISGYRNGRSHERRVLRWGGIAALVLAVVATGVAASVVLAQRSTVEEAIDLAEGGRRAAEEGQTDEALRLLDESEALFDEANDALDAPWARVGTVVPVVGQNLRALVAATDQGRALAAIAGESVAEANVDELGFTDGALDLDLVRSFEAPLQRSADQLAVSVDALDDARSPWLAGPVADRFDDFDDDLRDAAADADVAIDTVRLAPAIFGGDGDRRYLVLFTTPAEARGLGGFVGNYAELVARDGDVELTRSGRATDDLGPPPGAEDHVVFGPPEYVERWGQYRPGKNVQDTTLSPDFPSVAQVWEQIYPQAPGGADLDGVILVDPYGLAALMALTGPIEVPGWPEPLTTDNAADILLRQQYLAFDEAQTERIDFLDDATRLTFEKLTESDIPGPRTVIDLLGPSVNDGRLAVHSVHDDEQALFERTDIDNAFPRTDRDFLAVTMQNSGNNKIDTFLTRTIDYELTYDPATGTSDGTVTVELRNDAPASGLPDYVIGDNNTGANPDGTNVALVIVYTNAEATSATLDGEEVVVSVAEELGYNTYGFFVAVPPGGTQTARLDLEGLVGTGLDYELIYGATPTVNPDRLRVRLSAADGFEICEPGRFELDGEDVVLDTDTGRDETYRAGFCP